jgi:hypothetical protein
LYNIREYSEDILDYEGTGKQFIFSLKEDKKSEYSLKFESLDLQQKVIDLQGEIKCENGVKFSIDFVLESLEALA